MTTIMVSSSGRRRPGFGCLGFAVGLVIVLFAGVMLTLFIALLIWPGQVKLVAPLFCPDDQPDAFIVTDTYSVQPGETSTNFTLYCMGPDGDATDQGFALPFIATAGLNTGILLLFFIIIFPLIRWTIRRATGGDDDGDDDGPVTEPDPRFTGPATTAGPFVD